MKGIRKCKEAPSTDLLVCFPSRAHLTLMPSPASHHHHLKRSNTRGIGPAGQASPMLWKRTEISEPTSPKVTCAGQIKVRHKPKTCKIKNWQSVMEEIEKLHVKKQKKKKLVWNMEGVGFKKDAMQLLTCLRNIRFDFRCFGSFHTDETDVITSDGEDEDQEDEEENDDEAKTASRTVFSKWFMVLQENQKTEETEHAKKTEETEYSVFGHNDAPPPNALLLMRCRSAPAKGLLEQKHKDNDNDDDQRKNEKSRTENNNKKKNLVVMRYGSDFYKFSSDISKENWVVGGIKDPFSRSRSSKR